MATFLPYVLCPLLGLFLLQVCFLQGVLGEQVSDEVPLEELVTPGVVHTGTKRANSPEDEDDLVKGCTKACTDKLMPWPWQRVNGHCATNRQCYVCWGFCSLLQDKHNRVSLCNRSQCGSGCRSACNYVSGQASPLDIGFLVSTLVIMTCMVLAFLSSLYLIYLLWDRRTRLQSTPHNINIEETLSRQELQLLDIPHADKTGTNHKLLQVKRPMAQGLLRLLEDIRTHYTASDVSQCPSGGDDEKMDLVQVGFNTPPVLQIDFDSLGHDADPCTITNKVTLRDLDTLGVNAPVIRY